MTLPPDDWRRDVLLLVGAMLAGPAFVAGLVVVIWLLGGAPP